MNSNQEAIEVTENFLNTFQSLSPKQQKIWQLLHWYSTNYRNVFPSHATIAEKVGCCRDTVVEAIKIFIRNKWLISLRRCFRSSQYFMCDFLKKFDTRKNETFRCSPIINSSANPSTIPSVIPCTIPTLYNVIKESNLLDVRKASTEPETVQHIKKEKEHILLKMGITNSKDVFCLSRFPQYILGKAYEDLTTRWTKSGPINNLAAWITSRCKQYLSGVEKNKSTKDNYEPKRAWFSNGQMLNY